MKSSHPAAGWNERAPLPPSLRGTRGKTASEGGVVEWKKGWRVEGSRYKKSSRIKSRGCTLVKGEKRVVGVRLAWSPVITFSSFLFLSPPLVIPRGGCSSPPFLLDSSPLGDLLLVHRLSTFLACNYWPLNEGEGCGCNFWKSPIRNNGPSGVRVPSRAANWNLSAMRRVHACSHPRGAQSIPERGSICVPASFVKTRLSQLLSVVFPPAIEHATNSHAILPKVGGGGILFPC